MAYKKFSVLLAARLVLTGVTMALVIWLLSLPGYHGVTALASTVLLISTLDLWRYINRTNREISRFLDAARYADFSQRFSLEKTGTGFDELGQTLTDILERLHALRTEREVESRHLRAMIEHIPVPLLSVHGNGLITLQNNAARRLFGAAHVTRLPDLRQFGLSFHDTISEAVPGRRELVTFSVEGISYKLTLATTAIATTDDKERLISLQDIQSELDETQAQAWQDLVRVLTHEIMNSITPVTSLAKTAASVVTDILEKTDPDTPIANDLADLGEAVTTVSRRSDSLVRFVNSYRQFTRLAPAEKKRIRVAEMFDAASRLAEAEWPDGKLAFSQSVIPASLDVYADRDLLEPVLLNLLRNAWQATKGLDSPEIRLHGRLNRRGNVVIEVCDNGPGIPDDIANKIFVPFFTTKQGGSGVGLALARQVMSAQGGFIRVGQNKGGGAKFALTF